MADGDVKAIQSDVRILMAVLIAVVVLAIGTVLSMPSPNIPLSVRSDGADGAMALQLWLSQSGYRTRELTSWSELDAVDVLFLLDPTDHLYADDEGRRVQSWIRGGGTLVVAGNPFILEGFLQPFALSLSSSRVKGDTAIPGAPTLQLPPFSAVRFDSGYAIHADSPDAVAHLYTADDPMLVSEAIGRGQLWLAGMLRPFTNRGLHDPGSARMIANMLTGISPSSVIGFDEGGHGFGDVSQQTFTGWLTTTAPGWGILLSFGLTLIFLASRGRRFGRAEPLPDERHRRESAEYIHAMGALFRRSGQRTEVLAHYLEQLKRRLSDRYGVDPKLDANSLVEEVIARDSTIDGPRLRRLMASLTPREVSESALVVILSRLDSFLRDMH